MAFDDSVALWAGRAVVVLTALAALAGVFAWRAANRVAAAKDAQLIRFQTESKAAIAAAEARAAEAHERAAASELETARLVVSAAKERSARVALDRRTAVRGIAPDELKAVSAAMSKFGGQRAEVVVFPVNFETVWIADEIYGILLNAKWDVGFVQRLREPPIVGRTSSSEAAGPLLVQGIYIQATGDRESKTAASTLFESLKSTVASGVWNPADLPGPPRVFVFVGDKPAPLSSWVHE